LEHIACLETKMAPLQILAEVRRSPFEPFHLVLADGARYDIRHPDQCMVSPRSVTIGEMSAESEFIDWSINVNCHNVLRIERETVQVA
jgi:hypothetical protein